MDELRRDGIHTRVGTRNARKREISPPSIEHLHTSPRKDPKISQQPSSSQPHSTHSRRIIHDDLDDSDDSTHRKDYKMFSPQHPLKHPEDDDEPLYCLMGRKIKYIQGTIGNKSDGFAQLIRTTGLPINEARKTLALSVRERRLKKAVDKDFNHSVDIARKQLEQYDKIATKQEELRQQFQKSVLKVLDGIHMDDK